MSRAFKTIAGLSLLLNLLLAGVIVGHMCRVMMPMPARIHEQIEQVAKALPEDKRAHFKSVMQHAEKDSDDFHKQFEKSRDHANDLLKADHFDKDAFLSQMGDIEQIHAQMRRRMALAIAEAADDLSPRERATIADMLRPPPPPPARDNK